MTIALSRTVPAQRLEALEKANATRVAHASTKRLIKAGVLDVREVILDPAPELRNLRLIQVLLAMPLFGPARVNRVLRRTTIPHHKRLGELTQRQRELLVDELPG